MIVLGPLRRRWREPLRRWQGLDVVVRDLPAGLVLLAASFVPALQRHGTQLGDLPGRPLDGVAVLVAALECLPLAVRRRRPLWCLGLVALGFAVDQLLAYHLVAGAALAVALLSGGAHVERHRRATVSVLTTGYVLLAVSLTALGSGEGVTGFVTFYLLTVLAWGTGSWLRSSRAAEAGKREHAARAARAAERGRLARELHDVVTHHVTAMVVQAEAARYVRGAPDPLDEVLATIAQTGRNAAGDLRRLLDVLGPADGASLVATSDEARTSASSDEADATGTPRETAATTVYEAGATTSPDTAGTTTSSGNDLDTLVDRVRRAGQPVELVRHGGAVLDDAAGPAAFRVVQESLTNALKHAPGSRTVVLVRTGPGDVVVEIGTDAAGSTGPAAARSGGSLGGSGRGLTGLRERVRALGGEFDAGPRADGGFLVRARIPLGTAP
ncbi:sensor histidine kinase [Myceligenerans crystallogenes]|uniref:histidine kinase n=1 Tax=Myceligenerans crystallogenes TaxID=316335 RepID=A0ABN2NPX7_9MICO